MGQPVRGRPWSWIAGRPRLTDAFIVAVTFLFGSLSLLGSGYRHSATAAFLGLVALQASVLFWRRSRPVAVLLLSVCLAVVSVGIAPDRDLGSPALLFSVYAVSVYGPRNVRLWVVGGAIALLVAGVLMLFLSDFPTARRLLPSGASSLVAWVVGDYIRSRRTFFADLVTRHRQEREQAAEAERMRIARELHDVVAHNVSVIAINAGAARVSGGGPNAEALRSIEEGARSTLSELNRLVGVLRKDSTAPELGPQPTLADLDSVVLKAARDAGIDVTLKVTGDQRPLPAAVDLSAYRIVQECITNVLKHASATRVDVQLDYRPDALLIVVSDNGRGAQAVAGASTGHGLIGMRERVDLFKGELTTGTSSLGGFTVRARLPLA